DEDVEPAVPVKVEERHAAADTFQDRELPGVFAVAISEVDPRFRRSILKDRRSGHGGRNWNVHRWRGWIRDIVSRCRAQGEPGRASGRPTDATVPSGSVGPDGSGPRSANPSSTGPSPVQTAPRDCAVASERAIEIDRALRLVNRR